MKNKSLSILLVGFSLLATSVFAQSESFKLPPQIVKDVIDAKPVPTVVLGDNPYNQVILQKNSSFLTIEDLAYNEYRLAGIRISSKNFATTRQVFSNEIQIIKEGNKVNITGLPEVLEIGTTKWSPSNKYVAFANTTEFEVELWRVNTQSGVAEKINQYPMNQTTLRSNVFSFLDDESVIYASVPPDLGAVPELDKLVTGPAVQEVYGKKFGSRTVADIITTPAEEDMFEYLTTTQLVIFSEEGSRKLGEKNIYSNINISPDHKYLIAKTVHKPYSYITAYSSFPHKTYVMDMTTGDTVMEIEDKTKEDKEEDIDNDDKTPEPSGHSWRLDQPSTIYWSLKDVVKKKDEKGKEIKKNKRPTKFLTSIYQLSAPFKAEGSLLMKSEYSFNDIIWGNSTYAVYFDTQVIREQKHKRMVSFNPSDIKDAQNVLYSKSTADDTKKDYTVIGTPYTVENEFNEKVLYIDKGANKLYFTGANRPDAAGDMMSFVDTFDINTKIFSQLWISKPPYKTRILSIENFKKPTVLVSRQSPVSPTNYALVNMSDDVATELTHFTDPTPVLRELNREFVTYQRKDGVTMTAILITPKGYDKTKDGRLPVFMWAYPGEYRTSVEAEKNRAPRYGFTSATSAALIATQGYAVMLDMGMYIISKNAKQQPNDVFIGNLVSSAAAAIDYVVGIGVGDRNRIAVGGHSYGAFMTAHLLSQSDLFVTGVARSGAYNRTLTPYGFQTERRTYWENPEVYFEMSPFSHVDNLKEPILLIHGDKDENSGTFPVQSERLYHALSFHGGTSRYVVLPYDTHGYRAIENVYQLWWETIEWLDKYAKNAEPKVDKK